MLLCEHREQSGLLRNRVIVRMERKKAKRQVANTATSNRPIGTSIPIGCQLAWPQTVGQWLCSVPPRLAVRLARLAGVVQQGKPLLRHPGVGEGGGIGTQVPRAVRVRVRSRPGRLGLPLRVEHVARDQRNAEHAIGIPGTLARVLVEVDADLWRLMLAPLRLVLVAAEIAIVEYPPAHVTGGVGWRGSEGLDGAKRADCKRVDHLRRPLLGGRLAHGTICLACCHVGRRRRGGWERVTGNRRTRWLLAFL
eukprot:scaffold95581_cov33-Tisochrysis_lutea.AAC.3